MIQPQVLLRLPCYDFTPVAYPTFGSSLLAVGSLTSGVTNSHGVTGGVTLDFETVYSRAESADYWRIVNSYDGTFSYDALKSLDPRYADFRAFREKGVIYCNMREKPFYESMPMQPEVVLEDLIHAFHPDLLPDYKPTYYERLN